VGKGENGKLPIFYCQKLFLKIKEAIPFECRIDGDMESEA
jgi:hypothetical protein